MCWSCMCCCPWIPLLGIQAKPAALSASLPRAGLKDQRKALQIETEQLCLRIVHWNLSLGRPHNEWSTATLPDAYTAYTRDHKSTPNHKSQGRACEATDASAPLQANHQIHFRCCPRSMTHFCWEGQHIGWAMERNKTKSSFGVASA